jgi:23S rRNA pseudouridine1911/1915/1917 synthase
MRRVLEVHRGDALLRLDRLLVSRLPAAARLSRTRLAAWIREGRVEVDGVPATRASQRLRPGQAIALDLPEAQPRSHLAEDRPLHVLYEDDALLAIDKPAGLVMHPTRRHPSGTLMNALLAHGAPPGPGGEGNGGGSGGRRVHLVHRLDRETSGIVLVAKSPAVHATLARAMARRAVHKDYLAVVYGTPRAPRDRIDLRIRRDPETRRLTTSRHDGLQASTEIAVLASCPGSEPGSEPGSMATALTFLRCSQITGRLHQIRVHLAGVGLPIVGDPIYGEPRWKGIAEPGLRDVCAAFTRQALHAWHLSCAHPLTGAPLAITAPLPADLQALVDSAGVADEIGRG